MTTTPDRLTRFLLPTLGVRGAHVHLDDAWREAQSRSETPDAARELLGQTLAGCALFTAHVKVEGRLSVQMRSPGAIRSLFAECTAAGTVRGLVRMDEAGSPVPADLREPGSPVPADLRELGEGSLLAITIENPSPSGEPVRYQGLVPMESATLADAFEGYFQQSEQLPTRLLLAANGDRASGLLLQKLPGEDDGEGWNHASHLFQTLGGEELLATDVETLLHRLFHEIGVEAVGEKAIRFGCSCSRARVAEVLHTLGQDEALAAVEAGSNGQAEIHCEFCGAGYRFSEDEVRALFLAPVVTSPAPARLQ